MPTRNHWKQILIGDVRYISILTWIWAFQDKRLYLVVFSLYSSLFENWQTKLMTRKPRSHVRIMIYRTWPNTESCLCTSLFCSQVFKTSDVLNPDENIVNIALNAFCSLAVTKLTHWPMSSLLSCGIGLWSIVCYSVVVCFSFALIEFSLKRFLSFFYCFMPAALSRFGTVDKYSFGSLAPGRLPCETDGDARRLA